MALDSPAKWGRALNFGSPNPLPMWTKSDVSEFPFPHALGWYNVFQVTTLDFPPAFHFGPPFLDNQLVMLESLGFEARMVEAFGFRATIQPDIEREAKMVSERISRSVKHEQSN